MKNKNLSKSIAIVLLITVLTLIVIASTYAKYTSNFNGRGTAKTADWNVKVSTDSETYSDTFTITANDTFLPGGTGTIGTINVKNSSTDVKAKVMDVKIDDIKIDGEDYIGNNLRLSSNIIGGAPVMDPNTDSSINIEYIWDYNDDDETQYAGKPITFNVTLTVDQVTE